MYDISVCMITYNHEPFIEQAIKAVLKQKTIYSFELIIGDDCSTDNTRNICKKLAEKYPDRLKLLPTEKKLGMINNFTRTLGSCTGRYVALCDGDDYWTDSSKLQKQVNFLEANSDYAICCHRVYIKREGKKPKLDKKDAYAGPAEATYDIEMLAKYGNLIATPSVVYRNGLFSSFPSWFAEAKVADYVIHLLNAQFGKIKYFPEPMAVYRDHSKGAWGGGSVKTNAAGMIKLIECLLTEPFEESVKKGLRQQLLKIQAIYLNELMQDDTTLFHQEFDAIFAKNKDIAIALIEKMKDDMDALRSSRSYRAMKKLAKTLKRTK